MALIYCNSVEVKIDNHVNIQQYCNQNIVADSIHLNIRNIYPS